MRNILIIILIVLVATNVYAWGNSGWFPGGVSTVTEADGSPTVNPTTIKFSNGTVTDNGDGTVSVSSGSGSGSWTTSGNDQYSSNSGNVGVGSTTPVQKLDVSGTVRATSFQTNNTTAGSVQLYETSANGTNYIGISAPTSVTADKTFVLPSADGSSGQGIVTDGSGNLSFATIGGYWVTGSVGINTTSNVGISSTSPSQKLDVVGTVKATAFIGDGSGLTNVAGGGGGYWVTGNVGINTTSNVGIGTVNPGKGLDIATNGMRVAGGSGASYISNTNLGLGTTNPGQVLDINGRWRTVGIGTTTAGTLTCFKTDGTVGWCSGSVTGNACATCN